MNSIDIYKAMMVQQNSKNRDQNSNYFKQHKGNYFFTYIIVQRWKSIIFQYFFFHQFRWLCERLR